jgi:hypothetical protein
LTERLGGEKDIKKNNEKECHDLHLDDHCLQISRRYGALVLHAVLLDKEVLEGEERGRDERVKGWTNYGLNYHVAEKCN